MPGVPCYEHQRGRDKDSGWDCSDRQPASPGLRQDPLSSRPLVTEKHVSMVGTVTSSPGRPGRRSARIDAHRWRCINIRPGRLPAWLWSKFPTVRRVLDNRAQSRRYARRLERDGRSRAVHRSGYRRKPRTLMGVIARPQTGRFAPRLLHRRGISNRRHATGRSGTRRVTWRRKGG